MNSIKIPSVDKLNTEMDHFCIELNVAVAELKYRDACIARSESESGTTTILKYYGPHRASVQLQSLSTTALTGLQCNYNP
jgi:hypothetical protein